MNYQFSNIEFRDMMFNPVKVPEETTVFKVYPQLSKRKIFKKSAGVGLDLTKVMLFIFCMYDKNTPYRSKFQDVLKRKVEIAHDVGFKVDEKGLFDDPVEDFLKGKNDVVNRKIVEYVRMHRSFKYSYLVGIENSYYNIMLDVMAGETKRLADLRSIQEELETTMIQILSEDNNPHIKDAVLRFMEEERLQLRPEDIGIKMLNGEEPIDKSEVY